MSAVVGYMWILSVWGPLLGDVLLMGTDTWKDNLQRKITLKLFEGGNTASISGDNKLYQGSSVKLHPVRSSSGIEQSPA